MVSNRRYSACAIAAAGLVVLASTSAPARTSDGKPILGFSIAQRPSDANVDGPLLREVKSAFAAANQGSGKGFARHLAPKSKLSLVSFSGAEQKGVPFTAATIQAATRSCIGPWAFDEGASWVQLSWICSTDADKPLAKFLTFHNSPELSVTVWFQNGRIATLEAMEPLDIPGARRVSMNAFCAAISQGASFAFPSRCTTP